MVIFYNSNGEIKQVEHYVMTPTLPANLEFKDKVKHYKEQGLNFVCLGYELGGVVLDYKVITDNDGKFLGLQPKEDQ